MAEEIHTPITEEEIARTFDEDVPEVHLSNYGVEDWATLIVFWMMTVAVFLQFFTRYVMNDSFSWTEEIAIYCLVAVVFLGSSMCVRLARHIHVNFIYRFLPPRLSRIMATLIDLLSIVFFIYVGWLVWKYSSLISDEMMTTVELPKSIVFNAVLVGFVLMALRSIQMLFINLRRGYSELERPGASEESSGT